ncbi:MAG: dihydroorotate dehydrogenase electron transfer subunit [Gammaproteobacteria bacterium]|jgi:dihydroorotate dehydrogenase electron transfer subunit
MSVQHPAHRGSICLEDGKVLAQQSFPGDQFVIRIEAPKCAARALPGSFAHLTVDDDIPMRRPLSIMRADPREGWIDILYKIVGPGLAALARRRVGDQLSVLGPIGRGFQLNPERPRPLMIGGGVGIPPMVFLAETLASDRRIEWKPLVLMGSEIPFPFQTRPSTILVPGIPDGVIASMPLLDGWGIPSRLASRSGFPGCFDGFVTELAAAWLSTLDERTLREVEIFSCGPTPMLEATTKLAARFGLACQVSLEEFMACAVGGCAGCAVRVKTPNGPAMKRVCVDGPVFDGYTVFDA